jgi:hypothetical protein
MQYAVITPCIEGMHTEVMTKEQLATWFKAREMDPDPTDFFVAPVTLSRVGGNHGTHSHA